MLNLHNYTYYRLYADIYVQGYVGENSDNPANSNSFQSQLTGSASTYDRVSTPLILLFNWHVLNVL